jgi:hypothetical protein
VPGASSVRVASKKANRGCTGLRRALQRATAVQRPAWCVGNGKPRGIRGWWRSAPRGAYA